MVLNPAADELPWKLVETREEKGLNPGTYVTVPICWEAQLFVVAGERPA